MNKNEMREILERESLKLVFLEKVLNTFDDVKLDGAHFEGLRQILVSINDGITSVHEDLEKKGV